MRSIQVATVWMLPTYNVPPLYRLFFALASNFPDSVHNSELIQNSSQNKPSPGK